MTGRRAARLVAAVLVTAAAGLTALVSAPSASAAVCDSSSGVSVIADFNELGGGVVTDCIGDGAGRTAAELFTAAGLPLTDAQRQPGFVCRVAGKPSPERDACVNASPSSAYWGLWWSDGDAGSTWTYSSQGARSLTLPAGSLVAFSWDEISGDARPSAAATRPGASAPAPTTSPAPAPTPTPSAPSSSAPADGASGGSGGSGKGNGGPGSSGNGSAGSSSSSGSSATDSTDEEKVSEAKSPNDEPSAKGKKGKARKAQGAAAEESESSATPAPIEGSATAEAETALVAGTDSDSAGAADEDALAGWVGPTLIVVLFGGAAVAWWVRRRGALAP